MIADDLDQSGLLEALEARLRWGSRGNGPGQLADDLEAVDLGQGHGTVTIGGRELWEHCEGKRYRLTTRGAGEDRDVARLTAEQIAQYVAQGRDRDPDAAHARDLAAARRARDTALFHHAWQTELLRRPAPAPGTPGWRPRWHMRKNTTFHEFGSYEAQHADLQRHAEQIAAADAVIAALTERGPARPVQASLF